jgi:uncharacterized membrane protein YGL010W
VLRKWIANWFGRHRNRVNFALHMIGIPATVAAVPLAVLRLWIPAAALFVGGYALQFLGHVIEGNRSGEEDLFRRLIGWCAGPGAERK